MRLHLNTVITGTGSYIPGQEILNADFLDQKFFEKDETAIEGEGQDIIDKFEAITGISARRWLQKDQTTSSIAAEAAQKALDDSGIDPNTLDQIIVAHNYGDVVYDTIQSDMVPSLASRVKNKLGITNPGCIAYDVLFGCPGWVQAVIHVDAFIKAGVVKRALIIGAEALSRVVDVFDRDTMIFADGAGAAVVQAVEEDEKRGFLSSVAASHTGEEVSYLYMGKSNAPTSNDRIRFIKMHGRKIYEYSLNQVPGAMKEALEKSGVGVQEIKKILLHQANEKMDAAIVQRFYKLFGMKANLDQVMPMNIAMLGNSSVATVPTLYDMILKQQLPGHEINQGDMLIFASVGAGMNINAFVYRK
jgi:3-oxoacyl-[acyl-carrier-protein] synthase III